MTDAERARNYRQRRSQRLAALVLERDDLAADVADLRSQLGMAAVEGGPECRHPAEAVDGGTCGLCGQDLW